MSLEHLKISRFLIFFCLLGTGAAFADDSFNGTWTLNPDQSDDLQEVMNTVRREWQQQDDQIEEYKQKQKQKPGIFGRTGSWDNKRARAATSPVPKMMRRIVSAETIKIYYSRKLAISYDGDLKRLLVPNPSGRVYSASGVGLTKDAIGETLSYIQDGVLYIETRLESGGKLVEEIDPVSAPGKLVVNWKMKAPAIERMVEMTSVYDG